MSSSMPKEMKEKWIAALRSGDYIQGKETLYNESYNAYCCLGVLQHCLTGEVEKTESGWPADLPSKKWLEDRGIKFDGLNLIFGSSLLPIERKHPIFIIGDVKVPASTLNDSSLYSFEQIADLIEEQIEGV